MKHNHKFLCKTPTFFLLCFFLIAIASCTEEKSDKKSEDTIVKKQYVVEKNEVSVLVLEKGVFKEELLSNGKLSAIQKNDLKFEISGKLEKLYVKEGDYVVENSVIAELTKRKYQEELNSAETTLKKTLLELEDMLVNRGFDLKEIEKIPKQVYQMAGLRSGYTEALQKVKSAQYNFNATNLKAPFNGKIATINKKQYEQIGSGSVFLTLINDTYFEVVFPITESEIIKVKIGDSVKVFALGLQKEYKGKITSINPKVEKNGTLLVRAKIKNDNKLIEGMNVKIKIEKSILNQFVVPKTAIILRQDQEVLFKVINGKAYWTYVETVYENKEFYTVIPNPNKSSATLAVGDTIITNGNLNLAHDSAVTIKRK
jgi:RND family efflux transporter MFP subunit